jgi:serine/threonine-protein kinase HipA
MIQAESLCLDAAQLLKLRPCGDSQSKLVFDSETGVESLFVRRFDITEGGGHRHVVTLKSILGVEDNNAGTYQSISEAINKLSSNKDEDQAALYRQMLFNCAVGNIDDHLKNFSMTWARSEGWRLSPAYDITPACMANPCGGGLEHSIGFLNDEAFPGIPLDASGFFKLGERMGINHDEACDHANAVSAVLDWMSDDQVIQSHKINPKDMTQWMEVIHRNKQTFLVGMIDYKANANRLR